jgi:hypothetical protein
MREKELWELFHAMWGDAKSQPGYVKANWMALQAMLMQRLERGYEKLPAKASFDQPLPDKGAVRYRTLFITPKRDFGGQPHLIKGKAVMKGWIVTDGACNVMPGATWFETKARARHAIDVLIAVQGNAQMFWEIIQPFQHTPGDRDPNYISPAQGANCTCGRHYATYKGDLCVEVGLLDKPVYA